MILTFALVMLVEIICSAAAGFAKHLVVNKGQVVGPKKTKKNGGFIYHLGYWCDIVIAVVAGLLASMTVAVASFSNGGFNITFISGILIISSGIAAGFTGAPYIEKRASQLLDVDKKQETARKFEESYSLDVEDLIAQHKQSENKEKDKKMN